MQEQGREHFLTRSEASACFVRLFPQLGVQTF